MLCVRAACNPASYGFSPDGFHTQLAGLARSLHVKSPSPLAFKHFSWYSSQISPLLRLHGLKSIAMGHAY